MIVGEYKYIVAVLQIASCNVPVFVYQGYIQVYILVIIRVSFLGILYVMVCFFAHFSSRPCKGLL